MDMQEHESKEFSWLSNELFIQRCAKKPGRDGCSPLRKHLRTKTACKASHCSLQKSDYVGGGKKNQVLEYINSVEQHREKVPVRRKSIPGGCWEISLNWSFRVRLAALRRVMFHLKYLTLGIWNALCAQRAHQKYAYKEILKEPWTDGWTQIFVLQGFGRGFGIFVCLFLKRNMDRISPWPPSQGSKNYHVMNAGLLLGHVLTALLLGGRRFHSKTIILNGTVMQQRCCGGPGDHLPGPFWASFQGIRETDSRGDQSSSWWCSPQHQGSAGKAVSSAFFSPFWL